MLSINYLVQGDWTDIFNLLDSTFKLAEKLNLVPFRQTSLQAAEKWVLETTRSNRRLGWHYSCYAQLPVSLDVL